MSASFEPVDDQLPRDTYIVSLTTLKAVAWVLMVTCILLTIGRLIIRWRKLSRFNLDDYLNALAAAMVIPFIIICLLYLPIEYEAQLYSLGLTDNLPSIDRLEFSVRMKLSTLLLFWMIIYTVKASFLALYWHMFAVSTPFRIVWWCTTIFIGLSFGITFMSSFWYCDSPSKLGNLESCLNLSITTAITILSLWCSLNIAGSLLLMALPLVTVMPQLLTLQPLQRIGLIFVFCLVLVDVAVDIVRTVYSLNTNLASQTNLAVIWTFLEPTIAVIVCTLPYYKSLLSCGSGKSMYTTSNYTNTKSEGGTRRGRAPLELDEISAFRGAYPTQERALV